MTAHPGDIWDRWGPRSYHEPVLVLDGRRSIHAAWPPSATCERCGCGPVDGGGYVGPVTADRVTYPDPTIRFVCRTCARDMLGLADNEWTGHSCDKRCTDRLHVDSVGLARDELMDSPDGARIARFTPQYAERGWQVIAVDIDDSAPTVTGRYWAVTFKPSQPRW